MSRLYYHSVGDQHGNHTGIWFRLVTRIKQQRDGMLTSERCHELDCFGHPI